jgi:hypothetical protein
MTRSLRPWHTSGAMTTSPKKILFVLTSHDKKGDKPSGYYLAEATHPHKVLSDAGYASLSAAVENTKKPSEVDADEYAAIFYAGGHGTMWDLPDNAELAAIAGRIYDRRGDGFFAWSPRLNAPVDARAGASP